MKKIKFLTAGESHGKGLLGILQGIPSNLLISEEYVNLELKRRQKGFGRGGRMKIEKDAVEFYSGIRYGKTIGSPIGLIIQNLDAKNWGDVMSINGSVNQADPITLPRPGHADLPGIMKYDFDDIRNVLERSSARETTMRVAIGSICKKMLEDCNINIGSYVKSIFNITDQTDYTKKYSPIEINSIADNSSLSVLDSDKENEMINAIKTAQKNGDSVGGEFQIIITGVPYGLGSYIQWNEKLNASLGRALLSINAIKSVDFGLGSNSSSLLGSQLHDEIEYKKGKFVRTKNNAGGIEGGMSNAETIIITATMKPLSTLVKPLKSVDIMTHKNKLAHKERTDSCAVPAASIIAESMVAITIADELLNKFGGDSMQELKDHLKISAKY